jgi:sortase A
MTLTRGVGHIPGTALPGGPGNVGIAGHRDGFFRRLKDASVGDVIEVQESSGLRSYRTERYIVRKILVVFPEETSVLKASTASRLTLVTCYPFYYVGAAPQRYVVEADLLPESNLLDSKTRGD